MISFVCICGTRPEVIKMASIVKALKKASWAKVFLIVTAQHRSLLDQKLAYFGLKADMDLNIMQFDQKLPQLTGRLIISLDEALAKIDSIDMIIAQGDTTTTFVAALAAFYRKIPFGYIEAGLRSYEMYRPFPEEMNRILISRIAALNFAPTEHTKQNLLAEGIKESSIFVTGNTVIDVVLEVAQKSIPLDLPLDPSKKLILVTVHRREIFGAPFVSICKGIRKFADAAENVQIIYPVHPNPQVATIAHELLADHPRILLVKPLDYDQQIMLLKQVYFIMTDSGGIQEEAPLFGKPLLLLRDNTDRQEGVLAGIAKIIGTDSETIYTEAMKLLNDQELYQSMSRESYIYGDGHATERIMGILKDYFLK